VPGNCPEDERHTGNRIEPEKAMTRAAERQRGIDFWGWLFVLPTMAGLLILNIIPIFQTIWQSFFKVGDFGRGNTFVGLGNFIQLVNDPQVRQSLLNTLIYTGVEVPCSIVIAFVFAVMLNQKIAGRSFFRTVFFLPMVTAPAAVAMAWRWLYNANFGLFNYILTSMGFERVTWISNPNGAIFSIAAIGIWASVGYNMILFLAGLQQIPRDYYEAADIDGANIFHKHLIITLPLLGPTLYFIGVTRIIAAMQSFDLVFMVMDKSNIALFKTQPLVYLFYRYAFVEYNKGYGATIVIVLFLLIMLITVAQRYIQKRWVYQDAGSAS
jgi:multiple sugar transport system permease protein